MTDTFRRVPYPPDPNALTKSAKHPAKFSWWYVDSCIGKMTVAEAGEAAPPDLKGS